MNRNLCRVVLSAGGRRRIFRHTALQHYPLLSSSQKIQFSTSNENGRVIDAEDFKTFTDKINESHKLIAYFTAGWCPPCRAIKPVYIELSTKYPTVTFMKVDVDHNEEAASTANIRSIPAFHLYHNGKMIDKFVGADQKQLKEKIENLEAKP